MSITVGRIDDSPEGQMNLKRFHLAVAKTICCPDGCQREPCDAGKHLAEAKYDLATAPIVVIGEDEGGTEDDLNELWRQCHVNDDAKDQPK